MKTYKVCGTPCADETVFCYICGAKFRINNSKIDKGFISEYFVTNADSLESILDNPVILITDRSISDINDILPLLEECLNNKRQILIIADSYSEIVTNTLLVNKLHGNLACVAVSVSELGENKKPILEDIALLTGGNVVSSENGLELKSTMIQHCGQAKSVRITKNETIILDGNGNQETIKEEISRLKGNIALSQTEMDKSLTRKRLIDLYGLTESELN